MKDDFFGNNGTKRPVTSQCFIMSHISSGMIKEEARKEAVKRIKEYFEDPSKYLEVDKNIVVGRKPSGPKYDNNNEVIPRSVIGDPRLFRRTVDSAKSSPPGKFDSIGSLEGNNDRHGRRDSMTLFNNSPGMKRRNFKANSAILYEFQIDQIFEKAKDRVEMSREKFNKDIMKDENIPRSTKDYFFKQQKVLENNENEILTSQKISRVITAKINKPEEELLMNRTDAFRYKKQIMDLIDNNKPNSEKFGDNNWMLSLRREKVPTTMRINYINVGSNFEPKWKPLIEYPPKKMPIIQKPNFRAEKDVKQMLKSQYFQGALKNANVDLNNMNNIARMEITGKNLLENELKNVKELKGTKRIYMDPQAIGKNIECEIIKCDYNFRSSNAFSFKSK